MKNQVKAEENPSTARSDNERQFVASTNGHKELPILFSGPMVRAILEGRKTQTRRVVKPLPPWFNRAHRCSGTIDPTTGQTMIEDALSDSTGEFYKFCPYGSPLDRLWVREALRWTDWLVYDSDKTPVDPDLMPTNFRINRDFAPGIFMPRWASRLTLEITDVRVERLKEISCLDVMAEGSPVPMREYSNPELGLQCVSAKEWFQEGWDKLNAKRGYSWESNPWAWVVGFQRTNGGASTRTT